MRKRAPLVLLLLAAPAGADSTLPASSEVAAVEVRGIAARGAERYRLGLVATWMVGCGQGGTSTTDTMALELAIGDDGSAVLTMNGERREASWHRGVAGAGPSHSESRHAIAARYAGRARRAADALELDLKSPSETLRASCRVARVPFAEADSATIGLLECTLTSPPQGHSSLLTSVERLPFGRGAGVWARADTLRGFAEPPRVSLRRPSEI